MTSGELLTPTIHWLSKTLATERTCMQPSLASAVRAPASTQTSPLVAQDIVHVTW